jgi:hypothetical protein
MGHRLIEGTIPRIAKALERIADALEKRTPADSWQRRGNRAGDKLVNDDV